MTQTVNICLALAFFVQTFAQCNGFTSFLSPISAKTKNNAKSNSAEKKALKQEMLDITTNINYGLKATKKDKDKIAELVNGLEKYGGLCTPAVAFGKKPVNNSPFYGKWDLLYTDAPDVLSIGKIPSVKLYYVGQEIEEKKNSIVNVIEAGGFLADTRQEVVVRAEQSSKTRVDLEFQRTKIVVNKLFGQRSLFGKDVTSLIKPIEIEFKQEDFAKFREKNNRPDPAFEVLFLDQDMRVQRTAEGYLFIAAKASLQSQQAQLPQLSLPSFTVGGLGRNGKGGKDGKTTTSGNTSSSTNKNNKNVRAGNSNKGSSIGTSDIGSRSGSGSSGGSSGGSGDGGGSSGSGGGGSAGLGPWLQRTIGPGGMKALGLISLTPYLLFLYLALTKNSQ